MFFKKTKELEKRIELLEEQLKTVKSNYSELRASKFPPPTLETSNLIFNLFNGYISFLQTGSTYHLEQVGGYMEETKLSSRYGSLWQDEKPQMKVINRGIDSYAYKVFADVVTAHLKSTEFIETLVDAINKKQLK